VWEGVQCAKPVRLDGADFAAGKDQLLREARGGIPKGFRYVQLER